MFALSMVRRGLAAGLALSALAAAAAPADRIAAPLRARGSVVLRGSVHPLAQAGTALGRLPGDTLLRDLDLYFAPSPAQQADLDELLRQQQDPGSRRYHAWLTPRQYAERFGLGAGDRARVQDWLRGQGFKVEPKGGADRVRFSGTAAQVEAALHTELQRFDSDGKAHFANATELSFPAALSGMVLGVNGLDDFRPHPHLRVAPQFTSGQSGNHFLAPGDLATIYDINALYNAGVTGSGQKVAVLGQTAINLADVQAFRSAAGLSAAKVDLLPISSAGSDSPSPGDENLIESDIDIEWSGGIARDATVEFVYARNGSGKDVRAALQYAIENDVAPVISVSYGACEAQSGSDFSTEESWLSQAAAQGQTVVASSGDAGAADCDAGDAASAKGGLAVDYPASSPQVTGVGGTEFDEGSSSGSDATYWTGGVGQPDVINSAQSYIPEVAWNDTGTFSSSSSGAAGLSATGGGVSTHFSKPSWQAGTGVPGDGMRDVPDVSMPASPDHDGYLYCTTNTDGSSSCGNGFRQVSSDATINGTLTVAGGTSFSAPVFGGIMTLVAGQVGGDNKLGLANPRLYQLAAMSGVFHDITSGNNKVPVSGGGSIGCVTTTGYDPVTGLGSMDVDQMALAWSGDSSSSGAGTSSSSSGVAVADCTSGKQHSGGGGGGGAAVPAMLLPLLGMALLRRRRRGAR